ncbi:hypothetical protein KSP40_PGU022720 [Platanthera guangdongensis]|uniref:Uncharacterized protein n=1 Tax=Platanthera guangdongensis TaxID=2320717 RepID=A0ABR2LYB8_9ASPA
MEKRMLGDEEDWATQESRGPDITKIGEVGASATGLATGESSSGMLVSFLSKFSTHNWPATFGRKPGSISLASSFLQ